MSYDFSMLTYLYRFRAKEKSGRPRRANENEGFKPCPVQGKKCPRDGGHGFQFWRIGISGI